LNNDDRGNYYSKKGVRENIERDIMPNFEVVGTVEVNFMVVVKAQTMEKAEKYAKQKVENGDVELGNMLYGPQNVKVKEI